VVAVILFVLHSLPARAQGRQEPGKSIGRVSLAGDLILLELDEGALGKANMFDLGKRTLRFRPDGAGYRADNLPLQWDSEFGAELAGPQVHLKNFVFPFSGKTWDALSVGANGSIRLGAPETSAPVISGVAGGRFGGGVSIGRFDPLAEAAGNLVDTVPAICVFFKPRMSGPRYAKELADRLVVTWDVTEPFGNIQDFTWAKTVNRFQAVLHQDGVIEMSYDQLAARDAIVGVYPVVGDGEETALGAAAGGETPSVAPHLDLRSVKLAAVGGLFLKVTLETRGGVLPEGDAGMAGLVYRVYFAARKPLPTSAEGAHADAVWTIAGFAPRGRQGGGGSRYVAGGPGVARRGVKISGNTISIQGTLPTALRGAGQVAVYAESFAPGSQTPADRIPPQTIALKGLRSPEVHFSALKPQEGPFPVVYESFHYLALPNPRDLTCSVLKALGDKFDFLAYYSDLRVDNQEAGTPSNGPLGSTGPAVTGIGATQRGLDTYCSAGRFQWQFIQPVYVGSNQMQERPPADAPVGTTHDITFYSKQLGEHSSDGSLPPYMYAMSQIGHEMGHRWGAFVSARVNGETIPLGPTHWARGLQAPVAFPYQRPTEASAMGGGVWQDNLDGTFTQLDDDYYVPATGWSYLDLYLMGFITPAEVPDFFILRNLTPAGRDANGHPIFKADRTKVTIQDVIAAEGPRTPGVDKSQREFNTGMVMMVEHGRKPSPELITRTEGIRRQWIDYWSVTTGRRSTMTANPR
jgi:hypothetical protein